MPDIVVPVGDATDHQLLVAIVEQLTALGGQMLEGKEELQAALDGLRSDVGDLADRIDATIDARLQTFRDQVAADEAIELADVEAFAAEVRDVAGTVRAVGAPTELPPPVEEEPTA